MRSIATLMLKAMKGSPSKRVAQRVRDGKRLRPPDFGQHFHCGCADVLFGFHFEQLAQQPVGLLVRQAARKLAAQEATSASGSASRSGR